MHTVRLDQLRAELGEYVHRAEAGETIIVTEDDRPVARLVPPLNVGEPRTEEDVLARGVREGWITPPSEPRIGVPPSFPCMSFEDLMEEIARDREDR
ncbi:type II toxin-antitoxin system Phd/YefM family antitoxin [Enterovirga aerilata]|uniref:Antitoxin n=1 Tax=Enterovirga aerilata TaxID=2730920 RepID=A0A849IC57_9HYPH|nr:type II toxin-antitoxin system prevent-host-death family antitoxin [Enterovirga sp. DB1703]NNM71513.1 type II toxin-antitoxin system prevent-host-death family antitoxin [Enterovirga sp. DB1703]